MRSRLDSILCLFELLYKLNIRDGDWEFHHMWTSYPLTADNFLKERRRESPEKTIQK